MNILTIANLNPKKYGSFEKYCVYFTEYLTKRGHKHIICFLKSPIPQVKGKITDAGGIILNKNFRKLNIKESIILLKLIRQLKINIVHAHFIFPYSLFSFLVRFINTKYFITYHMGLAMLDDPFFKRLLKKIRSNVFGIGIEKIFCVSKYSQKIIVQNFQEQYDKTVVIYNGIDLRKENILFKKKRQTNKDIIKIITMANLIPEKGIQYLLKAASKLIHSKDNLIFMIAGDGPYEQALKDLAEKLGIEKYVEFLGRRNDIPELLVNADIAVIPSVVPEGFGFTVAEAMAANLPVVATNAGAISELVVDGLNGFIVEPEEVDEIAEALLKLINNDKLRIKMGIESRKRVNKMFNIQRVFSEQLFQYEKTVICT